MSAIIPVICFGPNPETFYVGCGVRYYAPNMPPSILNSLNKFPAIQIKWMSMDCEGQGWAIRDTYKNATEYATCIPQDIIDKLNKGADFLTFGPNKGNWFTCAPGGIWNGNMEDEMISHLNEIKVLTPNFDQVIDGILFGKGTTLIFAYKGGFGYYTDNEAEGSKLEKVLDEYIYRDPPWTIMRGSSLCLYDIEYYFLKFKDPQSNNIEMRWSLPTTMLEKLGELRTEALTPESQLAIQQHESIHMAAALNRFNLAVATGNALNNVMVAGSGSGYYRY
ncbi:hypothetical protein BDQ12DRAFT_727923 [Crucibulum laeve]|uniref:Uncharacterized protein n=1 Tax=Crucibulum laeve TaxID=68775 RepID=A0A5C3LKW8_9AGAR|nr:hypothetical protein BDQ12DRAFT_727923 [Crucibulum laeve]